MTGNPKLSTLKTIACELDQMVLEEAVRQRFHHRIPTALVIPGSCELAFELAHRGALVNTSDIGDWYSEHPVSYEGALDKIRFQQPNAPQSIHGQLPSRPYSIVVCQHGLNHLPYCAARQAVRQLLQSMESNGKLFLSAHGLHSELGDDYPDQETDIERRFCELSPDVAQKYDLPGKVCLYTERNLFSLILEAGGKVLRTFTTTYGNIKGIAIRN